MLLYHAIELCDAQGTIEVKKLSKQSESAADQAQMKSTSSSVCASLPDVRQRPSGLPKYSSCMMRAWEERAREGHRHQPDRCSARVRGVKLRSTHVDGNHDVHQRQRRENQNQCPVHVE